MTFERPFQHHPANLNLEQQQEIQALTATLKAQAAQIQKVSDQLGERAPAPRVVAND